MRADDNQLEFDFGMPGKIMKRPVEMLYTLCEIALADMAGFEKRFPLLLVSAQASQ